MLHEKNINKTNKMSFCSKSHTPNFNSLCLEQYSWLQFPGTQFFCNKNKNLYVLHEQRTVKKFATQEHFPRMSLCCVPRQLPLRDGLMFNVLWAMIMILRFLSHTLVTNCSLIYWRIIMFQDAYYRLQSTSMLQRISSGHNLKRDRYIAD